jgi:hypothetical protein
VRKRALNGTNHERSCSDPVKIQRRKIWKPFVDERYVKTYCAQKDNSKKFSRRLALEKKNVKF